MWTFRSTHRLRAPFFFHCHTTGDAFSTPPGCTGYRMPCRTIVSNFSLTLSRKGRGIFLALQNIVCDPGMSFTCALYPLTAGGLSSLTALMHSWGSMSLPSSPNSLSDCTTASCCCLYLLPFHSISHVSDPRSVSWWPSKASRRLIFPIKWGLLSSVRINEDMTVLSAPESTCIFILWSFTVMYSYVTDMLNTFSRA